MRVLKPQCYSLAYAALPLLAQTQRTISHIFRNRLAAACALLQTFAVWQSCAMLLILLHCSPRQEAVSAVASVGQVCKSSLAVTQFDADEDARLVPWPRQNVGGQDHGQGKQFERSATNGQLPSRP
jgi:hypothetical protein